MPGTSVSTISVSDRFRKTASRLKQAGAAARWLSATPPPRCADPKGYYGQMLATATAAADSAKAATRLSALILAACFHHA
jgi:hypothetical protein